MKNYLIAERYAKALGAMVDDAALDDAVKSLGAAAELYTDSEDLRNLLSSPAIDVSCRWAVLAEALGALECHAGVSRLIEILLRRGRITLLADVNRIFCEIADERRNRVRATVVTANALSEEQETRLAGALSSWCKKDVIIAQEVEPAILGGVIARIAGAVIDGSMRTRIERMREELLTRDIRTDELS